MRRHHNEHAMDHDRIKSTMSLEAIYEKISSLARIIFYFDEINIGYMKTIKTLLKSIKSHLSNEPNINQQAIYNFIIDEISSELK